MAAPVASAGMLIRRPPEIVFDAFIDPAVLTRFWFTDSDGPLEPGAERTWTWAMYGASTRVRVKAIERPARILIDWDIDTKPTEVEWVFTAKGPHTFVEAFNRGFGADEVDKVLDSAGGFALVLGGAKIFLEHGIEPNFVLDRHPDARVPAWKDR